jgi:WXG100 family type VII secretion target
VYIPATADPAQLDAVAQKIRGEARRLTDALDPLSHAAGGASWRGNAADAFQDEVKQAKQSAKSAAASLNQLAGAIEKGADDVRRLRAEIQRKLERLQREQEAKEPSRP